MVNSRTKSLLQEVSLLLTGLGYEVKTETSKHNDIIIRGYLAKRHLDAVKAMLKGYFMQMNIWEEHTIIFLYDELYGLDPDSDEYDKLFECVYRIYGYDPEILLNSEVFANRGDCFEHYLVDERVMAFITQELD